MGLTATLTWPLYEGGATATAVVPGKYDIAIGGRGYLLDRENEEWRYESIPLVRQQADASDRPGEQSLNPEDFWRRSQESWHRGAGQTFADRDWSDPDRFRASKGWDPWTRGELSLLADTAEKRDSANSNVQVAVAGGYCYALDGNALVYTDDITDAPPTWTTVTAAATALSSPVSLASDGYRIYACDATDIYSTTRGAATYAAHHTSAFPATLVRVAKGRLFTANGNNIYNNGASGSAVPSALFTHPSSDWTWVDVAEGPNGIYFAGYSGDKSRIYRAALKADGTALDTPVAAGELPDGEIIRSLCGYLGFLLIGTDEGLRFATLDADGNIGTVGGLISTSAVYCFEPQDRFVWFGWTNYDATSTGLGRVDLSTFNGTVPAYASDLMATEQGTVKSVATFQSLRVFAVASKGIYAETSNKVASATLETGKFGYGLADQKTALRVAARHSAGAGSYTVAIATDDGSFVQAGGEVTAASSAAGGAVLPCETRGERFELRVAGERDGSDATSGPKLTRLTLRADPGAARRARIVVPVLLHSQMKSRTGATVACDPTYERSVIRSLADTRQVTTYQDADESHAVIVDDWRWIPDHDGPSGTEGTLVVYMKDVA